MKTRTLLLIAAFVALFSFAHAQDTAPIPDLGQVGTVYGVPVAALLSVLGTLIVAIVKVAAPKIPSKALPFIAPVATVLLDFLAQLTFGTQSNPWLALGAGVASIGLYELKKRVTP